MQSQNLALCSSCIIVALCFHSDSREFSVQSLQSQCDNSGLNWENKVSIFFSLLISLESLKVNNGTHFKLHWENADGNLIPGGRCEIEGNNAEGEGQQMSGFWCGEIRENKYQPIWGREEYLCGECSRRRRGTWAEVICIAICGEIWEIFFKWKSFKIFRKWSISGPKDNYTLPIHSSDWIPVLKKL